MRDGKTAKEILIEQLDLLDEEMKKILVDLHERDTQALVTHGRFLRKKFADPAEIWLSCSLHQARDRAPSPHSTWSQRKPDVNPRSLSLHGRGVNSGTEELTSG